MSNSYSTSSQPASRPNTSANGLLTWLTLIGLLVGAAIGEIIFRFPNVSTRDSWIFGLNFVGQTLFLGPLKMILLPLIGCSILGGIASLGTGSKVRRVAVLALLTFWILMLISASWAAAVITVVRPAEGIQFTAAESSAPVSSVQEKILAAKDMGPWAAVRQLLTELLASNPVSAAAEGRVLPVIAISIALALALSAAGPPGKLALDVAASLLSGLMYLVRWILWIAPIGVAALIASTVGKMGTTALVGPLGFYLLVVAGVLLSVALIALPLFMFLLTRRNPYRLLWAVRPALLTAFSSASSSATVPVTLNCLPEQYVKSAVAEFVIPVGTAGNLIGTAVFQAAAVAFLFQANGIELHFVELLVLVITTWLASLGCAGVPSAAIVTMVLIIESVNHTVAPGNKTLPVAAISIVLGVDRLVDMLRTTVNVWGHVVVAGIVSGWADRTGAAEFTSEPTPDRLLLVEGKA